MRSFAPIALATALVAGLASTAEARPAPLRQAGTLTCVLDPAIGLVVGSARGASCTFDRTGRRPEGYTGTLSRVGVDLGIASATAVQWRVYTPGGKVRRGMLAGSFGGPSSEATVVVGPGVVTLLGHGRQRIALEPITSSGQAGLTFALGQAGLLLQRDAYTSFR
jgi:hypothetical protein